MKGIFEIRLGRTVEKKDELWGGGEQTQTKTSRNATSVAPAPAPHPGVESLRAEHGVCERY